MNLTRTLLAPLLALLLAAGTASGRTWQIHVDGTGDAQSIQAGIQAATAGDTVLVWPGTYLENINFLGKDVVLLSQSGPAFTTIDGSQGQQTVVRFQSQEGRGAILDGFTITGGQGTWDFGSPRGGGIVCIRSSPIVRNNRILRNESTLSYGTGGGMAIGSGQVDVPRASPIVEGNLFEDNTAAGNGGAMSIEHSDVEVRGNIFRHNSCVYDGAAIRSYFIEGSAVFEHNQFIENEAGDHAGGLYVYVPLSIQVPMRIEFNTFIRNVALGSDIGETGSGGGAYLSSISGSFANNTLVSNVGRGEVLDSGGGILIRSLRPGSIIDRNIIAMSDGTGISCRGDNSLAELGRNLLWENSEGNLGGLESTCTASWLANQLIADPMFCDPTMDDFTVASNSPAILGEDAMGAYTQPGCGPVAVERTTWGRIKARYGSNR